jgi:hypothetical protein
MASPGFRNPHDGARDSLINLVCRTAERINWLPAFLAVGHIKAEPTALVESPLRILSVKGPVLWKDEIIERCVGTVEEDCKERGRFGIATAAPAPPVEHKKKNSRGM